MTPRPGGPPTLARVGALLVAPVLLLLIGPSASAADDDDLPNLTAGRRVYDQTGRSLTTAQATAVQRRLETLQTRSGADVVVVVRDLDATPEETFDQVEELQQAWVRSTGTEEDTAGAILINREPGADDEARAGIFVGSTYDDGDIPRREQEDIVAQTLIPPLRDGDVEASLTDTVDRLSRDIRFGLPVRPELAASLGWTLLGLTLLLYAAALTVMALRPRRRAPRLAATTSRPDDHLPATVGAALTEQASSRNAIPATVLALAAARAVLIESLPGPPRKGTPTVRTLVRLQDATAARDDVQRTVWLRLEQRARQTPWAPGRRTGSVVDSRGLRKVAAAPGHARRAVRAELRERGWAGRHVVLARVVLSVVLVLALALAVVCVATATATGAPLAWVSTVLAAVLAFGGVFLPVWYPALSAEGRDAGQAWRAYRKGLERADASTVAGLDLDVVLPDLVALGVPANRLMDEVADRDTEAVLAALAPSGAGAGSSAWSGYYNTFASSAGSGGGGGFSGGGSGGGGGAAGST